MLTEIVPMKCILLNCDKIWATLDCKLFLETSVYDPQSVVSAPSNLLITTSITFLLFLISFLIAGSPFLNAPHTSQSCADAVVDSPLEWLHLDAELS